MFEFVEESSQNAVIKVIGVGGGGGNAVNHMISHDVPGVDFICANTDAQALERLSGNMALQLGISLTKGLGAGSDPEVGRRAAMEDKDRIAEVLHGADMIFITAGLGGGTGTGAAPVVAEIARNLGILSVAVVTKPFKFEGSKRMRQADTGIREMEKHVDSLITIPNEKLLPLVGDDTPLLEAFAKVDNVLLSAVQGIADLITRPGRINVDFADVRTVMSEMGMAMMGTGQASGENRARLAAEEAISSPLLEGVDLSGAKGILVNIASSSNLSLGEFTQVGEIVNELSVDNATVITGTVIDESMGEELRVTVVATGLGGDAPQPEPQQVDFETDAPYPGVKHLEGQQNARLPESGDRHTNPDYLDVPSFLREQAD